MRVAALALVALLLPLASANGEPPPTPITFTLEPTQPQHPAPTSLGQGDALRYDWRVAEPAGAVLYFSTHIHIGQQLVNLSEENLTAKQGKVVADRAGLYSVLWENHSNRSITFEYTLTPERAGGAATPFPWGLAVLGLAAAAVARRRP
ncbi:MAG TPA: hypothetical protein VGR28_10480 [Candidatus Thermoplasmatota archaeon]|jgi:MYXO-CTERM domain-containing protein|nr:hypothetical protein [Candidatus Thermoplasmatota archaeon]